MDQASIPPGPPHHVTILHMHTIYSQTQNNTYTKMNLSTVKWAQRDKTQSRELLGLFICVCSSLCTIVAHNTAQNRPDNFQKQLHIWKSRHTIQLLWGYDQGSQ